MAPNFNVAMIVAFRQYVKGKWFYPDFRDFCEMYTAGKEI